MTARVSKQAWPQDEVPTANPCGKTGNPAALGSKLTFPKKLEKGHPPSSQATTWRCVEESWGPGGATRGEW